MIPVLLTHVKTRDGIILDGIMVQPEKKSDTALIWLHGLASRFSSGQTLVKKLSTSCQHAGIAYFKFNTRGHDIACRSGDNMIGAEFEQFEDCVYDIRAMIAYARKLGYKKIILVGHSTGANKVLYYCYKTNDRSVKGLILLGAISDIVALKKEMGTKKFNAAYAIAGRLRKNSRALMPLEYGLFSAKRFWSLCHPGETEDTFPYYDQKRKWTALERIRIPLAVIIGTRDEYLDRTPKSYLDAFEQHALLTKHFRGIMIKGADHGFKTREKELARALIDWINKMGQNTP